MIYDEQFINSLPTDNILALKKICEKFLEFDRPITANSRLTHYEEYMDSYAALEMFIEAKLLDINMPILGNSMFSNLETIKRKFNEINNEYETIILTNKLEASRNKYKGLFQNGFIYEFSEDDLQRIQKLINELRDTISSSSLFEDKHKERLLNKLEGLQKELHKRVSSLDKFWGLIGDAGVAIGKFGKDSKPFVDRMKEIAEIIWRTQAKAEELPCGTKIPILDTVEKELS